MKKDTKEITGAIVAILGVNLIHLPYKIQLIVMTSAFLYLIISAIYMYMNSANKYDLVIRFLGSMIALLAVVCIIIDNIFVKYSKYVTIILALAISLIITCIIIYIFKSRKYKE